MMRFTPIGVMPNGVKPVSKMMPLFERYIGVDYSGAETAEANLKTIRVYVVTPATAVLPSQPRYWTRRRLASWLLYRLSEATPTIVGIDHGFSFPLVYFKRHALPQNWPTFLDQFQRHCPTVKEQTYVDFVREGECGCWLTETWTTTAKSVFRFDVQGAVAKATYAGIPWLRYLHSKCDGKVHFWPFDGWEIPQGCSVIAEVYPSLWTRRFPRQDRNNDQHAAYSVAAWFRRADLNRTLSQFFHPPLDPEERKIAEIEGWILGVV